MTTRHRRSVRPRYGRIAAFGAATLVTMLSGLGGLGVLSTGGTAAAADQVARPATYVEPTTRPSKGPTARPTTRMPDSAPATSSTGSHLGTTGGGHLMGAPAQPEVPQASGSGLRIVFSQHLQRVWLVGGREHPQRTYLVSGSVSDNLQPGTYEVYSRSLHASGIGDSGVMTHFVRFTQGPTGAAIGFHAIPTKDGRALQSVNQLGSPQSHGCIRQWKPDAVALWHFAPIGTTVVVVA